MLAQGPTAWDSGNLDLNLGTSASRLVLGARFSAAPTVFTQMSPDHTPLQLQGHFRAFRTQRLVNPQEGRAVGPGGPCPRRDSAALSHPDTGRPDVTKSLINSVASCLCDSRKSLNLSEPPEECVRVGLSFMVPHERGQIPGQPRVFKATPGERQPRPRLSVRTRGGGGGGAGRESRRPRRIPHLPLPRELGHFTGGQASWPQDL